jgi:2-acylglycerol O-acyltransferase 2
LDPGSRSFMVQPHDEALRRWADAQAADNAHAYFGMLPLENDAKGEAVAIVTMLLCFSWIYVGPLLTSAALVRAVVYHSAAAGAFLATIAFLAFAPVKPDFGGWGRAYVWQCWRRYFRFRWVTPKQPYLATDRHYLFLHFPHGIFPMGSWLSMALSGNESALGIPERTAGAVATIMLHLPALRYAMVKMGCYQAGRQNMVNLLQRRSVGLIPEGIAGVFRGANRSREQLYWSPRLGVCRIALLTGAHVVPVYNLGQSQVFSYTGVESLSRRLRATVGIFWGRWGLPLPLKTDLILAMGEPITVDKVPNPSVEQIRALHARIEAAVRQLYHQHKRLHPALDGRDLTVV